MSTAQGRQIGPPMVTHYDQHTRLPLTPNAAAVVASGTTPPPSSAPMNRVHQAPQPIVEVVTENQKNGQLSRYTLNHNRETIAPFTTGPRFTAARPALQPPNSNGYRAANRPPGGLAPLFHTLLMKTLTVREAVFQTTFERSSMKTCQREGHYHVFSSRVRLSCQLRLMVHV